MIQLERYVQEGIPSAKNKDQYFSYVRAPRSMGDAVNTFWLTLCRDRLGLESTELRSIRAAIGVGCVKLGALPNSRLLGPCVMPSILLE
jgi:hypothetical protein